jgi:hypothetical protein
VKNRAPLAATPYLLLRLTSVRAQGWPKRQLPIQADGLSGHVEEIWKDLWPESGWLDGAGESWERGPTISTAWLRWLIFSTIQS